MAPPDPRASWAAGGPARPNEVADDLTDALAMSSVSSLTSDELEAGLALDASRSSSASSPVSSSAASAPVSAPGATMPSPPPPPPPPRSSAPLAPKGGWVHFAAGGVGGMCGAVVTSPLDVVKTRLQSDMYRRARRVAAPSSSPAQGVFASMRSMAYSFIETGYLVRDVGRKEGVRALFKGLGPTLVGVVPARSINFYTYGNGKQVLANEFNHGIETPLIHLLSAATAGVVTATVTNPIWVVKTRLQLERARHSQAVAAAVAGLGAGSGSTRGRPSGSAGLSTTAGSIVQSTRSLSTTSSVQMVRRIVSAEGLKGLYKGITASYLGVTEGTLQWTLYEQLKKLSARPRHAATLGTQEASSAPSSAASRLTGAVGSAGVAKFVAALITYPHEVLRTRMRQEPPLDPSRPGQRLPQRYTGLAQTFRVVVREEGAVALYGGLSAHLMRVVPNATVMFGIYELFLCLSQQTS